MVDCWAQSLPCKVSGYCVQAKICGIPEYLCRIPDAGNSNRYGAGVSSAENLCRGNCPDISFPKDLRTSQIFGFARRREFKMVRGGGSIKRDNIQRRIKITIRISNINLWKLNPSTDHTPGVPISLLTAQSRRRWKTISTFEFAESPDDPTSRYKSSWNEISRRAEFKDFLRRQFKRLLERCCPGELEMIENA